MTNPTHTADTARFLSFVASIEDHVAQLEADGEETNTRELAFVTPTREMIAHGHPPFAVLPSRMVREFCAKTASPMPAPPAPGGLLVLVPYIAADGAPALRSFTHPVSDAAERAKAAVELVRGESIAIATSPEQRADLEALQLASVEWSNAVRMRFTDGAGNAREMQYRVLRLDDFDVVVRASSNGAVCIRRGPSADTIIVQHRPLDRLLVRALEQVRSHFEQVDRAARATT